MTRSLAIVTVCLSTTFALGADEPAKVAGEWKSTIGPMTFELMKGGEVKGRIVAYRLDLKGKIDGNVMTIGYDEGPTHIDATLTFEPGNNAFNGSFQASNGNRGVLNGWRPDPLATSAKPADFGGLWLTDLGLMELNADGSKVKGRYAFRGTSSIDGNVKGRHFDFKIKAIRTGPGWFDLDEKGTELTGAGGTDGMPGWYGWKGRKAAEYVKHVPLVAGKIVDGSTENLLTYSIRAPEGYKPGDPKKWPTILILHGSNMNGAAYVNTIAQAWPDIAKDYILLGINGELPSNLSKDNPTFNYTYINYMGRSTYKGFPGTDRESPGLVSEAIDDLKATYPIQHLFVGGHSQGGYLAYVLFMHFPEKFAGAFPISAEVMIQCDPVAFDDKALKAAQRSIPLAIVHGKTDPMVPFDSGSYASGLFLDAGWPAVRFFADDKAGHMFALLPVNQAIRWLEALTSDDPAVLVDFAEKRLKEKAPRDAIAALRRAKTLTIDAKTKPRFDKLTKQVNDLATPRAKTFLAAIKSNKDNKWVDPFLAYRNDFEFAEAAAPVMAEFDALRAQHDPLAQKAMSEARQAFQQGRRDDGYAKAREIVNRYYASSSYPVAKKWAAEKK
jgi:predicted esterase